MAQGTLKSVPRDMVQKKPPHGSPCNNCGLCCWSSLCEIGRSLFGALDGPCPALRFDSEQKSFCNVIANPQTYLLAHDAEKSRAAAELLLYAGMGCTMRINGERNMTFQVMLENFDRENRDALDAAAALWGIRAPDTF